MMLQTKTKLAIIKRSHPYALLLLLIGWLFLAVACRPAAEPAATPLPQPQATPEPALADGPTVAAPTPEPTMTLPPPPLLTNTPEPTAVPQSAATPTYRVIFVAADDMLNVRREPGVENPVVAELAPSATNVVITGPGREVAGSLWTPIVAGSVTGWVNSHFLTEQVAPQQFCAESAAELVDAARQAIAAQDGAALAALVHPHKGLRVHRHWWNPAVRLSREEIANIFTSNQSYYWGQADGTGDEMRGPFRRYIWPRLERNLLPAGEVACNELLHGATAGFVRLPDGYEGANFYSLYRPAAEDQFELDWGSWAIGIEKWQGSYYISFLVHFEWEI